MMHHKPTHVHTDSHADTDPNSESRCTGADDTIGSEILAGIEVNSRRSSATVNAFTASAQPTA